MNSSNGERDKQNLTYNLLIHFCQLLKTREMRLSGMECLEKDQDTDHQPTNPERTLQNLPDVNSKHVEEIID